MQSMDEYGVEYKIIYFSFFPQGLDLLQKLGEISKDKEKIIYVAEYAYPSSQPDGQFWFMNKPSLNYPLTEDRLLG
jgi:hypothetical protein